MKETKVIEILTRLKEMYDIDSTRDLFEKNEFELLTSEGKERLKRLDEKTVITFDGDTYPREGWAVIMSGGTGAGKGVVRKNQIMLRGKVIDVDKLKELYADLDELKRGRNWDFKNPEDVKELHYIIKEKGWKEDLYQLFFSANNRLENIIFDITGKTVSDLERYSRICREIGYNVSLVWTVTNRAWALLRNLARERTVPETIFHQIHNLVRESVFAFLDTSAVRYIDEAWVVFSGDFGKVFPEELPDSSKDLAGTVHRIERQGSGFVVPDKLKRKILIHLGPREPTIQDPERYQDYDTILQTMKDYDYDEDKQQWVGYDQGLDFLKYKK